MLGNISNDLVWFILFGLNLVGLYSMWFDKKAALKNKYRLSEGYLLTISLFGAAVGVWIGMFLFHHKTRKMQFRIGLPLIIIGQLILIILIAIAY